MPSNIICNPAKLDDAFCIMVGSVLRRAFLKTDTFGTCYGTVQKRCSNSIRTLSRLSKRIRKRNRGND
jgi:hypothetical protein